MDHRLLPPFSSNTSTSSTTATATSDFIIQQSAHFAPCELLQHPCYPLPCACDEQHAHTLESVLDLKSQQSIFPLPLYSAPLAFADASYPTQGKSPRARKPKLSIRTPQSATFPSSTVSKPSFHRRTLTPSRPPVDPLCSPRVRFLVGGTLLEQPLRVRNEMRASTAGPTSPPELSSSKSSKSSSLHTSSLAGNDAIAGDLAHFEDIGLDDDERNLSTPPPPPPERNDPGTIRKSSSRLFSRQLAGPAASPQGKGGLGNSLTVAPVANGSVNGAPLSAPPVPMGKLPSPSGLAPGAQSQNLALPVPQMRRPRTRSPSPRQQPFIGKRTSSRNPSRSPSRSPSASHMMQGPVPASAIAGNPIAMRSASAINLREGRRFPHAHPHPSHQLPGRRQSAKEIEDTYNELDAGDDELPDDANLWNVPMSPNVFREVSSATNSANGSLSGSPERMSPMRTPIAGRSLRPSPRNSAPPSTRSSSSPNRGVIKRGVTVGTVSPPSEAYGFGKPQRAKSWNDALSDLSEEARSLSEALDAYAAEVDQKKDSNEEDLSDSEKLKRVNTVPSLVELPPLRKNNVMIDPLPVSKEKEAVLSRTRPSWLPPKDPKEEKKHLKEYRRMMELSLENEKKRVAKEAEERSQRRSARQSLQRIWAEHVFPNWAAVVNEPRTRELWWRGIPASSRPEAWRRAIGNDLGLTARSYEKALERSRSAISATEPETGNAAVSPTVGAEGEDLGTDGKELAWLRAIRRDCITAFPALRVFQPGQRLHRTLIELLAAFSHYRADVGYSHGSHMPAALLLLVLGDVQEAFICLANLLNRPLMNAFLVGDEGSTRKAAAWVEERVKVARPKLGEHLFGSAPAAEGEEGKDDAANNNNLAIDPLEAIDGLLRSAFLAGCCTPPFQPNPPPSHPGSPSPRTLPPRSSSLPLNSPNSSIPNTPASAASFTTEGGSSTHPNAALLASNPPSTGLSLPLALRLWDVLLFEPESAALRIAAGAVAAREHALYGSRDEVLGALGWGLGEGLRLGGGGGSSDGMGSPLGRRSSAGAGVGSGLSKEEEAKWVDDEVEKVVAVVRSVGKEKVKKGEKKQ